jgi:hypothetical protein
LFNVAVHVLRLSRLALKADVLVRAPNFVRVAVRMVSGSFSISSVKEENVCAEYHQIV